MMPKLSTTDPSTPKKSPRTLSIADLASPLTPAMASAATALTSPAATVRSYFFASPSAQQQQQQQQLQLQAEQEERKKNKLGIQNSCYNYFYYNQAEKQSSGSGTSLSSNNINLHNMQNSHSLDDKQILETYGERIQKKKRLALQELHIVLDDAEQFRKLQQRLRDASCQTNGALKLCWTDLLRERHEDYTRCQAAKEAQQRASAEALASRLDQVNLANETSMCNNNNNNINAVSPKSSSSSLKSNITPSPKSIMDLPFSSPSPSPPTAASHKISSKLADAVMELPFSNPSPPDDDEELLEEEEDDDVEEHLEEVEDWNNQGHNRRVSFSS